MDSVRELLREYQHYVMAYRLRRAVGGRVSPRGRQLPLAEYAALRIERQGLAQALVRREVPLERLRDIDRLTEQLAFGFWHNSREVEDFLRAALKSGGHAALGDAGAFAGLLSPGERERLGEARLETLARYYHTCLSLASPGLDPGVFERLHKRIESLEPPLFVDELPPGSREA